MPRITVNNPRNVIDAHLKTNYFRLRNTGGPKGDKGDTGATGPQGPKGDTGNAATVYVGSTTTLPVGQDATVTNTGSQYNAVLNFGIPQGPQGPQGAKGDKGDTGATGPQGAQGPQGPKGTNATVYIGTTSTGNPGTQASVYNSGTDSNAVLNFTIPQGVKGDTGATGATGATGPTGPQGPQGETGPRGSVKSQYVAELPASGDEDTFYLVDRDLESHTATGEYINFETTQTAAAIQSAQLNGNATQTTYSGKNKINNQSPDEKGSTVTWTPTDTGGEFANTGTWGVGARWSFTLDTTKTYTVHAELPTDQPVYFYCRSYTDSTYETVSSRIVHERRGTITQTFTPDTQYVQVLLMNNTAVSNGVAISNLQLEQGSSYTSFEPYVGGIPAPNPEFPMPISVVTGENTVKIDGSGGTQEFPIDLGSIELAKIGTYQDRIYKDGEKWYIEKQVGKVVLDGTEDGWGRSGVATANNYYCTGVTDAANVPVNNKGAISPTLQSFSITQMFATKNDYGVALYNTAPSQIRLCFPIDELSTLAQVTTWLSTHPTTVYYALATPTVTEITNQTLIDQLEALASATLNQGVNNIFTEIATGNAMPTLELNWVEWEKYNRHNVYIWNDDIDDWQVIVS